MEGFQLPPRKKLSDFFTQDAAAPSHKAKNVFAKSEPRTPRKGRCWTEDEHLAFLAGLKKLGKGNWTGIARYYVPTRTSTQIASHAQKYLQRITGATKRKSKFTDIEEQAQTTSLAEDIQPVWPLPDHLEALQSSSSAPVGTVSPSPGASQELLDDADVPPTGNAQKVRRVCRPTPGRASASEPDLVKLAESLISLSDPARAFSVSDTSAFKRKGSVAVQ